MIKTIKTIAGMLMISTAVVSHGATIKGTVGTIRVALNSDTVTFGVRGANKSLFTCAGAKRFSFSSGSAGGANIYHALLDAQANKKSVKVVTNDSAPCASPGKQAVKAVVVGIGEEDDAEIINKYRAMLSATGEQASN